MFTVKEFLALPVYEEAREAQVGENFLLKGKMSRQQESLNIFLEEHGGEKNVFNMIEDQKKRSKTDQNVKVKFWRKYKDGNIGEYGAIIKFLSDEKLILKDDKLIINLGGDNDLKFEASGTNPIDNDTSFGDAKL